MTDRLTRELLLEKFEPVAVVGMAVKFPAGIETPGSCARFLREGGDATTPVPPGRWDQQGLAHGETENGDRPLAAGGGFVTGHDHFDPQFFGISPKEAESVDPQHRWVLECSWHALEDANIDPARLRGCNGGVYLGVSQMDFALAVEALPPGRLEPYLAAGTAHSAAAGRVSYLLGWRGPCLCVDTACSSSLVALHLAVTGLRRRECDIALSGGVNATHHPRNHVVYSRAGMLSPDGKCRTFDQDADGYARGEGCGMLVLKRLSDAKRDGDEILALVRGSAVGQDGESGGLTVPNGTAQRALMLAALDSGGLEAGDVSYVEAHGTATPLGDPIEMDSINAVFAAAYEGSSKLPVASVKTNIGHLEAAAGIGGVIKAILQLRDRTIYPHINVAELSRRIPWDEYRVRVPRSAEPWDAPVRRAMVNSFGYAGTISSAVLEQAPPARDPHTDPADGSAIFTLSARSETALRRQVSSYLDFLRGGEVPVADLCYTANVARAHLPARLAGPAADTADVIRLLETGASATAPHPGKVAFLFTRQGSQYHGMGVPLYRQYPVFREHVDACDALFAGHLGRSVKELMFGNNEALHQTLFTQPALFTLEYALAMLWRSWGIQPSIMAGHSIGEVTAAAVAGVWSLADAAAVVATRARLMQSVSEPGAMAAVSASPEELQPLLERFGDVRIAAVNAPREFVISGRSAAVLEAVRAITETPGLSATPLNVSHAFHSPLMAGIRDEFAAELRGVEFRTPQISFVSNITGEIVSPGQAETPQYWARHVCEPVNFAAAIRLLDRRGGHIVIEIGPSAPLIGLARKTADPAAHLWLASMRRRDSEGDTIRDALARCYTAGATVDWAGYHRGKRRSKVALPGYAFEQRQYPLPGSAAAATAPTTQHELLGAEITTAAQRDRGEAEFRAMLSPENPAYLADHVVAGRPVFPGAAYAALLLELQDAMCGEATRAVRDLKIHEPLFLSSGQALEVRTRVRPADGGDLACEVVSVPAPGAVRVHASARIASTPQGPPAGGVPEAAGHPVGKTSAAELYATYARLGLPYGPQFRRVEGVVRYPDGTGTAELRGVGTAAPGQLPSPLLDCALQALGGVIPLDDPYLPVGIDELRLFKKPRGRLRVTLRVTQGSPTDLSVDLACFEQDRLVFTATGARLTRVSARPPAAQRLELLRPRWLKRSLPPAGAPGSTVPAREVLVLGAPQDAALDDLAGPRMRVHGADSAAAAADVLAAHPDVTDVCFFWTGEAGLAGLDRLRAECGRNYRELLELLRALAGSPGASGRAVSPGPGPRLWLVTRQGQWLPGDGSPNPALDGSGAASLWGAGHVLLNEHPALRATLVDLPESGGGAELAAEMLGGTSEYQVAYRAAARHVKRIVPADRNPVPGGPFSLTIAEYGSFDAIRAEPAEPAEPGPDEVTVQVRAAGLNFRDVLNVLGMLREFTGTDGLPLGFEAAGVVVTAGERSGFSPGDEIMLSRPGCMRSHVTVPAQVVVRKPPGLSFEQAAALPVAYVTAWHALHDLARVKAGDRVLIHAAAGGVGQAAVRLAQRAGAEVLATASPRKWHLLRDQGVRHVMNSRDTGFAEEALRITGGRGVDVVLNSLSGEHIPANVRCLAADGRFIELGKLGIWSAERMHTERPDVQYEAFDLSEYPVGRRNAITHRVLTEVAGLMAGRELFPPPVTGYELDELDEALGMLSRGGNTGKLVLRFPAERDDEDHRPVRITPDETCLVTGGTGALGLATARALVRAGARHLSLMSRHAPSAGRRAELERELGATVTIHQGDVAESADVERIMREVTELGRPLAGIVHAAGELADAPLSAQTPQTLDRVLRAKAYGAWLLHRVAAQLPSVRFFAGYSSVSSVLGAAGQANYAAGNAFLDILMHARSAAGLPGLSINWGPWSGDGMTARLSQRQRDAIAGRGVGFVDHETAVEALPLLLGRPDGQLIAGRFDWERYLAGDMPARTLLAKLSTREHASAEAAADVSGLAQLPPARRQEEVTRLVRAAVARLLRFDSAADVSPGARFTELGLDSLAAVELRNALESQFQLALPTSALLEQPTIADLAAYLSGLLAATDPDSGPAGSGEQELAPVQDADAELAELRRLAF